jgi:hypothetical protein
MCTAVPSLREEVVVGHLLRVRAGWSAIDEVLTLSATPERSRSSRTHARADPAAGVPGARVKGLSMATESSPQTDTRIPR